MTEKKKGEVGTLFWINQELYMVTKMGKNVEGFGIPMDVELVEW